MRHAPVLLLLATGCDTVTPPERPEPYAYTVDIPNEFNLAFHWPAAALPVRVWAEPSIRSHVAEAIRTWESLSLYGEFRGVVVEDSARADVVMVRSPESTFQGNPAVACGSFTLWSVHLDTKVMTLPFLTFLTPRAGADLASVNECLTQMATHELGHALGLLRESPFPADLMYDLPTAREPSARDRASFAAVYHTPATATVPTGR